MVEDYRGEDQKRLSRRDFNGLAKRAGQAAFLIPPVLKLARFFGIRDGQSEPKLDADTRQIAIESVFPDRVTDTGISLVTVLPENLMGDEYGNFHTWGDVLNEVLFDMVAVDVDTSAVGDGELSKLVGESLDDLTGITYGDRGRFLGARGRSEAYSSDFLITLRDRGIGLQVEHLRYPSKVNAWNMALFGGEIFLGGAALATALQLIGDIDHVGRVEGQIEGLDKAPEGKEEVGLAKRYALELISWRKSRMADPNLRAGVGTISGLLGSYLIDPMVAISSAETSTFLDIPHNQSGMGSVQQFFRENMEVTLKSHPEYGNFPTALLQLIMRMRHTEMVTSQLANKKSTEGWQMPPKPSMAMVYGGYLFETLGQALWVGHKGLGPVSMQLLTGFKDEFLQDFVNMNGGIDTIASVHVWLPTVHGEMVKKVLVDEELRDHLTLRLGVGGDAGLT